MVKLCIISLNNNIMDSKNILNNGFMVQPQAVRNEYSVLHNTFSRTKYFVNLNTQNCKKSRLNRHVYIKYTFDQIWFI